MHVMKNVNFMEIPITVKLFTVCHYHNHSLVIFLVITVVAIAGDTIGQRRGTAIDTLPGLPPLVSLDVRLVVEVGEEEDEGDGVGNERVVHPLGEVTVDVQRV